ncbi:MAG: MmgE/PrpD family protein [Planctomycetota bacterium]
MSTLTRQLAEFAVALRYEDLPDNVVRAAKRFLFDSVGCAFGGSRTEDVEIALSVIEEIGGREEASLFVSGKRTDCVSASLANALMIRAMDYNDIYWKQDPSHPSDIIPAAIAAGERAGKTGRDLITGIVLAYEIEQRLCEIAFPGIRERKWHHATLTAFASPLVAGKMLDLDVEEMTNAVGISACHSATLGCIAAGKLTMMKNTADPMATQAGMLAALLAKRGLTGPEHVLDGKEGLMQALGPAWKPEVLTHGLGERFRILECSMKAFPTEALTHTPLSAVLKLRADHHIQPARVKGVLIRSLARAADILADASKYKPDTRETADHSLPYVIAAALVDGRVTPEQFEEKKLRDPTIRAMLPKIKVVADPEIEKVFPALQRTVVEITLDDGTIHSTQLDYPTGDPRNPMSDGEIKTKFDALASPLASRERIESIQHAIWNVEAFDSIGEFMRAIAAC